MPNVTFKTDEIKTEVLNYVNADPTLLQGALLSDEIVLNKHTRLVTKVNGAYPSVVGLMSHVVQPFYSKKFTPFGDVKFKAKELKNFHQKVDFLIDPAEILGTVYAQMYDEGKNPKDKRIANVAIEMLKAKIIDDVNMLSVTGEYDAATVGSDTPEFGTSMDGLNKVLEIAKASTTNPVFFIPGSAITANNVLAEVTAFEKSIPSKARRKIKKFFMSDIDVMNYVEAYDDAFGSRPTYDENNQLRTRFGKIALVGLEGLPQGTLFATFDENLLRLVDIIENPATITDVQVENRQVKVLGEFHLGYDFGVNQYVYVHTSEVGVEKGLNNAEQNELFYPGENLIVTP